MLFWLSEDGHFRKSIVHYFCLTVRKVDSAHSEHSNSHANGKTKLSNWSVRVSVVQMLASLI